MPRKVVCRQWRGDKVHGLDPAIAQYLIDGNWRAAVDDMHARERSARQQDMLTLWIGSELEALWQRHREGLEAAAARQGIKGGPWWSRRPWPNSVGSTEAERQRARRGGGNGRAGNAA